MTRTPNRLTKEMQKVFGIDMVDGGLPVGVGSDAENGEVIIDIGENAQGDWAVSPANARILAKALNDAADAAEAGVKPTVQ